MDTPLVMLAHAAPAADAPRRAATVVALAAGLTQAPEWIQVFPAAAGVIATQDGRSFRIRDVAAVIAASLDGERELAIDFDHAIDLAAKDGRRAPAAGWISALEVRGDGLWAKVAWTPLGQHAIANREYRFLSPVFTHSKDGEVLRVLRASLTNNPAFDMTALAQAQADEQQETASVNEHLKKALQAAGLDPAQYATEETALAALAELGKRPEQAVEVSALAAALGLEGQAPDGQTVLTAIAALKQGRGEAPDPAQYVDIATFKATQAQLAALQASIGKDKATAAVDAAIREGRLIPAQRDWGIAYASKDLEGFRAFAAAQPQIVGGRVAPQGEGGAPSLTPEEKVICSQLGITEETFIAQRKREEAAA